MTEHTTPSRRAFIKHGALVLPACVTGSWLARAAMQDPPTEARSPALRVGLLTDIHYADKDPAGTRHYRDSIEKIRNAVADLNELDLEFAVELGDFIDASGGSVETEIEYLKTIEAEYEKLDCDRHYVLGNHCIDILTKDEFLANCAATTPHHSFDAGSFHFVILDACYRENGEHYGRRNGHWQDTVIPDHELQWLTDDLAKTAHPSIVFVHQRLDETEHHSVKNHAEVRAVLEGSGRVHAVFQGHSHQNAHVETSGIHYCVVRGMVEGAGTENNGYAELQLFDDGSIIVRGFGKQASYDY